MKKEKKPDAAVTCIVYHQLYVICVSERQREREKSVIHSLVFVYAVSSSERMHLKVTDAEGNWKRRRQENTLQSVQYCTVCTCNFTNIV